MCVIEVVIPLQKDIQKLDHLLQIQLLILIQFKCLNRQLDAHCQLAAITTEYDFGVLVDHSSLGDALVVAHHAVDLDGYLVEVQSLPQVNMGQGISKGLHDFVLIAP